MSTPVHVYVAPISLLRTARKGGAAAAQVRAAFGEDVPPLVERFLTGAALATGDETVEVMELLVQAVGRRVPSRLGGGASVKLLDQVDEVLARSGLPDAFRMSNLVFGGCPIADLPWPGDTPSVGYIEAEVVTAAIERFGTEPPTSEDANVDELLSEIHDWLLLCRRWQAQEQSPLGLVGIFG